MADNTTEQVQIREEFTLVLRLVRMAQNANVPLRSVPSTPIRMANAYFEVSRVET